MRTLLILALLSACAAPRPGAGRPAAAPPEAVSLLGAPLHRRPLADEVRARLERDLADARARHAADPRDVENVIWLGRRLAYLERYREAIEVFSRGIREHPDDARLYRHRGHRYITLRDFDRAVQDLERAAALVEGKPDEVEPDGAPNRYNIPTSTLHSNIWYHLGLARYLRGEWEPALADFRRALAVSTNDDMRVASLDWVYLTLRRLGRAEEARRTIQGVSRDMRILENHAYHRRLLMYRGELPPDSLLGVRGEELETVTQGYGVGSWYLYGGDAERARAIFRRVVESGYWAAFGYIAAEAELARR